MGIDCKRCTKQSDYNRLTLSNWSPYCREDFRCDDECDYTFKLGDVPFCRHGMTQCERCKRVWDGCAQCNCSPLPSSSDDEEELESVSDVFAPRESSSQRLRDFEDYEPPSKRICVENVESQDVGPER